MWIFLLTMLQGVCGTTIGLIISAVCETQQDATQIALGIFYPNLILSGIIWPVESMPTALRYEKDRKATVQSDLISDAVKGSKDDAQLNLKIPYSLPQVSDILKLSCERVANLSLSNQSSPSQNHFHCFRYFSYILPQTFACEAMRGILLRGWGLTYMPVWRGFLVTIAWIVGTYAIFKRLVIKR